MHDQWLKHLQSFNATIVDDQLLHFGHPEDEIRALQDNAIMTALTSTGLIQASGTDSSDFLQGQFSNDVKQISEAVSQLNAYCSPKGRILASFRLFRTADQFYMALPRELLASTLKRLRMFVMRSQVTLDDMGEQWCSIGIAGRNAEQQLAQIIGTVPAEINDVQHHDGIITIRIPGQLPRFELHGPTDRIQPIWDQLAAKLSLVGEGVWSSLDIQAGIPVIKSLTTEKFVPQMVNLQAIGGLSFKKGCYPGQEIVARTQYLGKLKKRMFRAHIETQEAIQPGDNLYGDDAGNPQSIGTIVDAQPATESGYDVLAVIQITEAENNPVHLHNQDGPILAISELPYSLES